MKLSVVIVNYNVEHFLEQCLISVRKSMEGIDGEVFVVDNNSVDGSVRMVRQKFPEVHLIANKDNVGFSKANNQAILLSKGEYVLLLNPDTVVEDSTFSKVVEFMDSHPDAGGLGVKMLDGKGHFLPESKRGLPTPQVAFYKISGLSRFFPRSKVFGRYHLGFLDNDQVHEVEILSGAFMMLRKEVLDKTGLLDETFFMYGEDIDLSWRIIKAGYKNYYFPLTRIIHYKGESTKKSSVNYVLVFYKAMIIFARKHFSKNRASWLGMFIKMAVYGRAALAIVSRLTDRLFLPLADTIVLFGGIWGIKEIWETYVLAGRGGHFSENMVMIGLSIYTIVWIFAIFFSGGYDRPVRLKPLYAGVLAGSFVILLGYSLLNEGFRFSRAIILLGTAWAFIGPALLRFLLHFLRLRKYSLVFPPKRIAIIGSEDEIKRVGAIIDISVEKVSFMTKVSPEENFDTSYFDHGLNQLREIQNIYNINEVIFCAASVPSDKIIDLMSELNSNDIEFKIAPPSSTFIIGSKNISSPGDLYIYDISNISRSINLRRKRTLDINIALLLLAFLPFSMIIQHKPLKLLKNIIQVLFGIKSWVGFNRSFPLNYRLPKIKNGILNPADFTKKKIIEAETIDNLNRLYARDYKVSQDIVILLKNLRNLGR